MLFRLYRLCLLPGLALALTLAFTCTAARATTAMEQTQMSVFIADAYLSAVVDLCAQKQPELQPQLSAVLQAFRQRLRPDIERGREVGRALAEAIGKDIDEVAQRLSDQTVAMYFQTSQNPSMQRLCAEPLLKSNNPALWSINDFLKREFDSLMMEAGNRQGLPCMLIAMSFERLARRFLELQNPPPDTPEVAGFLLNSELGDLKRKTSNCLAVQTRAAEYRVVPDQELGVIAELLSSMEGVFAPEWERRTKTAEVTRAANEKVEEFLRRRAQK